MFFFILYSVLLSLIWRSTLSAVFISFRHDNLTFSILLDNCMITFEQYIIYSHMPNTYLKVIKTVLVILLNQFSLFRWQAVGFRKSAIGKLGQSRKLREQHHRRNTFYFKEKCHLFWILSGTINVLVLRCHNNDIVDFVICNVIQIHLPIFLGDFF